MNYKHKRMQDPPSQEEVDRRLEDIHKRMQAFSDTIRKFEELQKMIEDRKK